MLLTVPNYAVSQPTLSKYRTMLYLSDTGDAKLCTEQRQCSGLISSRFLATAPAAPTDAFRHILQSIRSNVGQ
jgi:hypothetical protein